MNTNNQTNQIIPQKEDILSICNNNSLHNKGIDEPFYNYENWQLLFLENSVSEIKSCLPDDKIEKMPTQLESFSLAIGILAVVLFW